jgi:hypothetical protein
MRKARADVGRAEEVGANRADRDPQAQVHLKRANEDIKEAEALMKDGKNKQADILLQRADAEAELALTLAKEYSAKQEALAAQDKLKALKGGK